MSNQIQRTATAAMLLALLAATARAQPASADIAKSLQPLVDNHTVAGAVALVADKDKVLSLDALGMADLAAKSPMRADNIFWIASMTRRHGTF